MREETPLLPSAGAPTWDTGALAQALHASPTEIGDPAFGHGLRFALGGDNEPNLDIYPASGVLRLCLSNIELTLYDLTPPSTAPAQVVFEQEQADGRLCHLSLTSRGEVTLLVVPLVESPNGEPRRVWTDVDAIGSVRGAVAVGSGERYLEGEQLEEDAYLRGLEALAPPHGIDEYGLDDAVTRRLLDEGLGRDHEGS